MSAYVINIFILVNISIQTAFGGFITSGSNELSMSGDRKKGCLVSIEGIDGAGKSTQIRLLDEWLRKSGIDAIILKEPTDGVYGRQIRQNAAAHKADQSGRRDAAVHAGPPRGRQA